MIDPETYDALLPLFLRVARDVRRENSILRLDVEDLRQICAIWCIEHPRKLREYLDDEDTRKGEGQLYSALRNACRNYAKKERRNVGYHESDSAYYRYKELRDDLLPLAFNPASLFEPPQPEVKTRGGDPAVGNNWVTTIADVRLAVAKLSAGAQQLLHWWYVDGYTHEEISEYLKCSRPTVTKRVTRAIREVQKHLGGAKPFEDDPEEGWEQYVGTRTVISNATARAITGNQ